MSDWSCWVEGGFPVKLPGERLTLLTGELRSREPLRDDQWVKGYHAALFDIENAWNERSD